MNKGKRKKKILMVISGAPVDDSHSQNTSTLSES